MPTYTVTYSNTKLSAIQMEGIAQAITKTHNECTGANTYFAQVIFQETPSGKHFMGGKPAKMAKSFYMDKYEQGGHQNSKKS